MDHVAIMKKKWGLTQKILTCEKTIESRWYKNKVLPWGKIKKGDTIYFKDSGEPVTVCAKVSEVIQYENLNSSRIKNLLDQYGERDLGTSEISDQIRNYVHGKNYCIIIYLENPHKINIPFEINKKGFGMMSAWICVKDIEKIVVKASSQV